MAKVLKVQRIGFTTPTVAEYNGKILATNQLDIESTCRLWRIHFTIYPEEKVDTVFTEKEFNSIRQHALSDVKSIYDLLYERNFIPRIATTEEEMSMEWGMYRAAEIESLKKQATTSCEDALKWEERSQQLLYKLTYVEHKERVAKLALKKLIHEMCEHDIRAVCDEDFLIESRLADAEKELAEERNERNKDIYCNE